MGLDTVELLLHVEEHFEIAVSDRESVEIETVGQFRDVICRKLKENGQRANPEKILAELSDLIADQFGIERNKISASSHIVGDLRID